MAVEQQTVQTLNSLLFWQQSGPEFIKLFFMLNSFKQEILNAHKYNKRAMMALDRSSELKLAIKVMASVE